MTYTGRGGPSTSFREGGAHVWSEDAVSAVANFATLVAVASDVGRLVWCEQLRAYFQFTDDATPLTVDGITVLATSVGGNTRWERLTSVTSLYWQRRTEWFLDPIAGDDATGDGTALSPIQSFKEWFRRTGGYFTFDASVPNPLFTINMVLQSAEFTTQWPEADPFIYPLSEVDQTVRASSGIVIIRGVLQAALLTGTSGVGSAAAVPATNTPPIFQGDAGFDGNVQAGRLLRVGTVGAWILRAATGANRAQVTPWFNLTTFVAAAAPAAGIAYDVVSPLWYENWFSAQVGASTILRVEGLTLPEFLPSSGHGELQPTMCREASTENNANVDCVASTYTGFIRVGSLVSLTRSGYYSNCTVEGTLAIADSVIRSELRVNQTGFVGITGLVGCFPTSAGNDGIEVDGGKVRVYGSLYGSATAAATFGLRVRSGGEVRVQVGVTPTIVGTSGALIIEDGAAAFRIPPLVSGLVVPAASALSTWANWAGAPFARRAMAYSTGSCIVTDL
jgi:hypothetical protein